MTRLFCLSAMALIAWGAAGLQADAATKKKTAKPKYSEEQLKQARKNAIASLSAPASTTGQIASSATRTNQPTSSAGMIQLSCKAASFQARKAGHLSIVSI